MQEAAIVLLKYSVDKINFEINEQFDYYDKKEIKLNQNLERAITKIDENTLKVSLHFSIYSTQDNPNPFIMQTEISGVFKLENWERENKQMATVNTVAILFPFLRALIATITANTSVPPYIIPVINVAAWLDNKE